MKLTDEQEQRVLKAAGWEPDVWIGTDVRDWVRSDHDYEFDYPESAETALKHPITTVALLTLLLSKGYDVCLDCAGNVGVWLPDSDAPGGEALALGRTTNEAVIAAWLAMEEDA